MTQDGIATGLALSRAHVALELKRLKTSGRVGERMAHVAHARSRRKVYELTHTGQEIARKMRDHARPRTVQLNETGGLREVPGSEAIEALRRTGLRESDAVQHVLAADVIEVPRPEGPKAAPPGRPFFGRADEQAALRAWLDSSSNTVAMVIGVAGIGKSTLVARVLEGERRPTFARRVYAHDDPHGLLSSFADFLARQGRRRLKAVITRPAYDPVEAIAVLRSDLSGCIVAIDDLHTCPAADGLLRPLMEDPVPAKILVASRVHPSFYERSDVLRGRVVEMTLAGLDEPPQRNCSAPAGPRSKPMPSIGSSRPPTATRSPSSSSPRAGSTRGPSRRNGTSSRRSSTASTIRPRSCCAPSRSCGDRPARRRPSARPCPNCGASSGAPSCTTGTTDT